VIDLLPTTLDLVGIKIPEEIRGIKQQPIEGKSLAYSIDDAKAPSRHTLQYYYIFGSRSIYDGGWKAELAYPNAQRWLLPSASPLSAVFDTRCGFPVRLDHEILSVVA